MTTTTTLLAPDPLSCTTQALIRLWRGDLDRARTHLAGLSPADLAQARMVAQRLVLLARSLTPDGVAAAVLAPDSLPLPAGVDGFNIAGRAS